MPFGFAFQRERSAPPIAPARRSLGKKANAPRLLWTNGGCHEWHKVSRKSFRDNRITCQHIDDSTALCWVGERLSANKKTSRREWSC
jgi:hypothetical protein